MAASVAIAVVSWNTKDLLRACLTSIEPDVASGVAEAWVIDNGSADGSAAMVRDDFGWTQLIALSENPGFGTAVNMVAQRTNTPWIACANADVELAPGALKRLLAVGSGNAELGIAAPRLVLPDGTTQHSVYPFPTVGFTLAFNLGLLVRSARLADRFALEGHWNAERARFVDWAIGAFLLVRRQTWDAVGGFDPTLWIYAEDLDLGWRAAAAGWRTWFEPTAVVRHHASAATSQLWGDQRDVRWQRSTYAWMLRRRGAPVMRTCALINTAGAAARAALLTIPGALLGGEWRQRWRAMVRWTRLHLTNLLAPRAALESHR